MFKVLKLRRSTKQLNLNCFFYPKNLPSHNASKCSHLHANQNCPSSKHTQKKNLHKLFTADPRENDDEHQRSVCQGRSRPGHLLGLRSGQGRWPHQQWRWWGGAWQGWRQQRRRRGSRGRRRGRRGYGTAAVWSAPRPAAEDLENRPWHRHRGFAETLEKKSPGWDDECLEERLASPPPSSSGKPWETTGPVREAPQVWLGSGSAMETASPQQGWSAAARTLKKPPAKTQGGPRCVQEMSNQ